MVFGAMAAAGRVIWISSSYPRTDDAEVVANFIGMAPLVEGPLMQLSVRDNDFVKKGQLLYKIDDRPYLYTLQRALAAQKELEGAIENEARRIAAQKSAVDVAQAVIAHSKANQERAQAEIEAATADVVRAEAVLRQAKADATYAQNNYNRLKPLLLKLYVTPDDVDRAQTLANTRAQAVQQAESQLALANARLGSSTAQKKQAASLIEQSNAQFQESSHAISVLDPLIARRDNLAAAVRRAQYELDNCNVYAPFDARVTNLTISEGQYVKVGQQLFTLIDTRTWWVMANFRETQLEDIHPGAPADIFLMSNSRQHLNGIVESLGFGVTPDPDVVGKIAAGLPDTQRTLNWVRLASRYPVRIRIVSPPEGLLRVSEVAVVTMRAAQSSQTHP